MSSRCAWISPVVSPFAYSEITLPDKPSRRRRCLGTVTGSNVPARSRGTARSTSPISVVTRLGADPFREFPDPRPSTA